MVRLFRSLPACLSVFLALNVGGALPGPPYRALTQAPPKSASSTSFEAVMATLGAAGYRGFSLPDPAEPLARLQLADGRQINLFFLGCAPGSCRAVTASQTLPCPLCDTEDHVRLPSPAQVAAWNRVRRSRVALIRNSLDEPAVRLTSRLDLGGTAPRTQLAWLRAFVTETGVFRTWLGRGGPPPPLHP